MTIPKTPIKKKIDRFEVVCGHLVAYMELARSTKNLLAHEKRLSPQLDLRLTTEINFCQATLVNVCHLPTETIQGMVTALKSQPDFEDEVKSMAGWLCPGSGRLLITTDEFRGRPALPSKSLFGRR